MKDPAVLFYFQDFLVGTEFMTDEEVGQYIRILCHQADKGALSGKKLLRICKTDTIPDAIKEKLLVDENGNYYQKRMQIEREKRVLYTESRRKNRTKKEDNICITYDKRMEKEDENININKDISIIKEDFIAKILHEFKEAYKQNRGVEYEITNKGKERSAAGKLLGIYKKRISGKSSDETLADLRRYFDGCVGIDDNWIYTNMSLPIILNKFNEINTILRHGNKRQKGATDAELAAIVAKHFAE